MKKIALLGLMLVLGSGVGMAAQQRPDKKKVTTAVFATDIECESCVNKIMNNVPSLGRGIKEVEPNIETQELTVVYDASKNSAEQISERLAALRVQAELKSLDGEPAGEVKTEAAQQK